MTVSKIIQNNHKQATCEFTRVAYGNKIKNNIKERGGNIK